MAEREFSEAQRKLEQTLTKLKETKDPKLRLLLLREMRRLLADADRILDSVLLPNAMPKPVTC